MRVPSEPPMNAHRLVEITPATHRVDIDLVYATDRNLTGKPIYRRAHCCCWRRPSALRRAVNIAAQAGFTLRIYDAYRRRRQQVLGFPARSELHRRSRSRLESQPRHRARPDARRRGRRAARHGHRLRRDGRRLRPLPRGLPEAVQRNRLLLLGVMHAAGFAHIDSEWWHLPRCRSTMPTGPWHLMMARRISLTVHVRRLQRSQRQMERT